MKFRTVPGKCGRTTRGFFEFLYAARADNLPALINVARGDIALLTVARDPLPLKSEYYDPGFGQAGVP